jgi:1-phosphofructokinase
MTESTGRVAIFAPNPLLAVTIEARGDGADEIHLHPGGQGVWVARAAGELGAHPVLCALVGGETGEVLAPLLDRLLGDLRLARGDGASGCYVIDRRSGERVLISQMDAAPASRHEYDDLFSHTAAAALEAQALVICNPYPAQTLPLEVYGNLASDAGAGTRVLVDLSSPRLESALEGGPDLVKINDWELAQFVSGPVDDPERLRAAAERLRARGARDVIITRGAQPALVLHAETASWLVPPRFERGAREGCGDTMMGAIAAALSLGRPFEEAIRIGAAAGTTNFLRHGLGSGDRSAIEEILPNVELRPFEEP